MIVQIYEIHSPGEAEACISLGVDHVGSVLLSEAEWRSPLIREVVCLTQQAHARSCLIPLFQEDDVIYKALDYYRPDFVHFCDSLTDPEGRPLDIEGVVAFQERIRGRFPQIRIIRTIPIPPDGVATGFPCLLLAAALEHVSDLFLIDTWLGQEPVEGYVGITGRTADWKRARELVLRSRIPVILAGGLSPENVYEALIEVSPHGADSCTHTNAADPHGKPIRFKKDLAKVERFVREVRRAERTMHSLKTG